MLRSHQTQEESRSVIKTHDYELSYRGYWSDGGVCRIRIYECLGHPPVVVASELDDNTNTSVTNMAEYLAAEVIARHFPERFEHDEPLVWIEHYARTPEERRREIPEYALVEFENFTPRTRWLGGKQRVHIGQPSWHHIDAATVEQLTGDKAVITG